MSVMLNSCIHIYQETHIRLQHPDLRTNRTQLGELVMPIGTDTVRVRTTVISSDTIQFFSSHEYVKPKMHNQSRSLQRQRAQQSVLQRSWSRLRKLRISPNISTSKRYSEVMGGCSQDVSQYAQEPSQIHHPVLVMQQRSFTQTKATLLCSTILLSHRFSDRSYGPLTFWCSNRDYCLNSNIPYSLQQNISRGRLQCARR